MSEQEEKVLYYCREWYRTGREVIKQTLWYEIGVMLENEPDAEQGFAPDGARVAPHCVHGYNGTCPECGAMQTPPRR